MEASSSQPQQCALAEHLEVNDVNNSNNFVNDNTKPVSEGDKRYHFESAKVDDDLTSNSKFSYSDADINPSPNGKYFFQSVDATSPSEDGRSDSLWVKSASTAASTLDGSDIDSPVIFKETADDKEPTLTFTDAEKSLMSNAIAAFTVPHMSDIETNRDIEASALSEADSMQLSYTHTDNTPSDGTFLGETELASGEMYYNPYETTEERLAREAGEEKARRMQLKNQQKEAEAQRDDDDAMSVCIEAEREQTLRDDELQRQLDEQHCEEVESRDRESALKLASLQHQPIERTDSNTSSSSRLQGNENSDDDDNHATEGSDNEFSVDRSEFPNEFDCDIAVTMNMRPASVPSIEMCDNISNGTKSVSRHSRRNSDMMSSGPVNTTTPRGSLLLLDNVITTVDDDDSEYAEGEINSFYDEEEVESGIGFIQEEEYDEMENGPIDFGPRQSMYDHSEEQLEQDTKQGKKKKRAQIDEVEKPKDSVPRDDRCCSGSDCVIM